MLKIRAANVTKMSIARWLSEQKAGSVQVLIRPKDVPGLALSRKGIAWHD
jgi:hypothetical protein